MKTFTQCLAYTITTAALVIKSGAEGPPNILAKKYREIRDDKNTIFTIFAYSLCLLIYFCAVFLTTEDHWRGLATLFNLGLSTEVLNYSSKIRFSCGHIEVGSNKNELKECHKLMLQRPLIHLGSPGRLGSRTGSVWALGNRHRRERKAPPPSPSPLMCITNEDFLMNLRILRATVYFLYRARKQNCLHFYNRIVDQN